LADSTFKLDFYLLFKFDPSLITLDETKEYEFVNGAPIKYGVTTEEDYSEYRINGDFFKTFDFKKYPFEVQLQIERKSLDHTKLNYVPDL
jgi:hypothetical protein